MRPLAARRAARPPRAPPRAAATTGAAVVARAAGAPVVSLPGSRARVARLVAPGDGGVPLAVDLELYDAACTAGAGAAREGGEHLELYDAACTAGAGAAREGGEPAARPPRAHTLVYCLSGAGALSCPGAPAPLPLAAGDCAAAPAGATLAPAATPAPGTRFALAALVVTLPADGSERAFADVVAAAVARLEGGVPAGALAARDAAAAVVAAVVAAAAAGGGESDSESDGACDVPLPPAPTAAAAAPAPGRRAPTATPSVRRLADLPAFVMPAGTNRVALAFDPARDGVPYVAGVEVFAPGHATPRHTHARGHELFFAVSGAGTGECDGVTFALGPGDVAIFPPGTRHGIDVAADAAEPLVCVEVMSPDDAFADAVRAGEFKGGLTPSELCQLAAVGCGGGGGEAEAEP